MNDKIWVEKTGKTLRLRWNYEGKKQALSLGVAEHPVGFVEDIPACKVTDAVAKNVVSQWLESASNTTVKEYLDHIKGCWDWANDKYSVVDPNPWDDSLTRSRSRDNNRVPKQPKPFTIAEFQAIVSAFVNHPHYSHYTDLGVAELMYDMAIE